MAKMPLASFFLKNDFFLETQQTFIFVGCAFLVFSFLCGIASCLWVRWERLGAVKKKVPALSVAVVGGGKRGT